MKLLLKLMVSRSCFGADDRRKEETITLGRPPEVSVRKTPRRRSGVKSADEWKPSLCSILEDRAVTAAASRGGSTGGGDPRTVAAKPDRSPAGRKSGSSGSRARVHIRGSDDDYRGASYTAAIPAFSPTPFMF